MRKLFYLFLTILCFPCSISNAQYVNIPDANFRSYLQTLYPSCMSGSMMDTTCSEITGEISMNVTGRGITDLTGVQYFDALKYLYCYTNYQLTSLPPLPSTLLELYCYQDNLSSLPTLPAGLQVLFTSQNSNLTSLPALPASLTSLYCEACKLNNLPALPVSLDKMWCGGNQINSLPPLPPAITFLSCPGNLLTVLPTLPSSLITLDCGSSSLLTSIPVLPSSLQTLSCGVNPLLTHLPSLPSSLITLNCNQCSLVELPALPPALETLNCYYNQLNSLPDLPASLKTLTCYYNNITCVPYIPNSIEILFVSYTNVTCIPNLPTNPALNADITTVCTPSNNSNGCTIYPLITGRAFADLNGNGIQDNGENGYANAKLEVQPGGYILQADGTGFYSINVDTGFYTVEIYAPLYPHFTSTPSFKPVHFAHYGEISSGNDFAMQPNTAINDLYIVVTPLAPLRPGIETAYNMACFNAGTTTLNESILFEYENSLTFLFASPAETAHTGNTLNWNFTNLRPGEYQTINTYFSVPSTAIPGTIFNYTANVNPISGDQTPGDNEYTLTHKVTAAFDPNFKEVLPESDITTDQIADEDNLTYTVHFQNTGIDTAFIVLIRDTISTNFELQGIETLSASHNYSFAMKDNAAAWTFREIQLPDSTTDERRSHGFVKYRIIPKNTLLPGDEMTNTAHIVFDYNAPVKTNTTINRVAIPTINRTPLLDQLKVYPNPSRGLITVSSTAQGSGTMRVINSAGKTIQNREGVMLSNTMVIDLSAEQKGMYLIQMVSDEGMLTEKVIVH